MLDSRNFVLNTGVRTFEASAFLRNRGADPVTVKKLFAGSMESYKLRAEIVGSAAYMTATVPLLSIRPSIRQRV